jgi:hypothetical protein
MPTTLARSRLLLARERGVWSVDSATLMLVLNCDILMAMHNAPASPAKRKPTPPWRTNRLLATDC